MPRRRRTLPRPAGGDAIVGDPARAVFGQVMGLVAVTVGCAALGAYIGRDLSGGTGIVAFIAAFACVFGLNAASAARARAAGDRPIVRTGAAAGLAVAPVLAVYAKTSHRCCGRPPARPPRSSAALGAYGYATRRDLSSWARTLFWALLGSDRVGIVLIFVSIPQSPSSFTAVAGLAIFGAFTIFDFNRLRRRTRPSAVPIAASIFLDIFNVFLLLLQLFGGGRD